MADERLEDVLDLHFNTSKAAIHTAFPAKINSYDPSTMTCSIQPLIDSQDLNGTRIKPPVLYKIPLLIQRTSGSLDVYPIKPGDIGLAVCSERSIGDWKRGNGDANFPTSPRQFDITDAYFIPGGYPTGKTWNMEIPANARGIATANGTKLFFGPRTLLPVTGARKEIFSMTKALAEVLAAVVVGVGTGPDLSKLNELITALGDLEA